MQAWKACSTLSHHPLSHLLFALSLFGDEVGEGGGFAEVDAESASGADMGEGDFECIRSLRDGVGLHGSADKILLLVVGRAGRDILIDDEAPLIFSRNGVDGVGADRNGGSAESELGFGEESHGSAAGRPGLAVGRLVSFAADGVVADVDLAVVAEGTRRSGGRRGLRRADSSQSEWEKKSDDEASAEHERPPGARV